MPSLRAICTGSIAIIAALVLGACSSNGSTPTPTPTQPSPSPSVASDPSSASVGARTDACPNPEGGSCLGPITAGSYRTVVFTPQISYTVPDGWGNFEDTPGNFLLIPPGGTLAGVNPGTSDYIGIYTGVAAESQQCDQAKAAPAPGVGRTPTGIAAYWSRLPAVTMTAPKPATVGGLNGVVVDLVANKSHNAICTDPSSPYGYQPLILGMGPASLEHGLVAGPPYRVYLLTWSTFDKGTPVNLTIEIEVNSPSGHLDSYSTLLDAIHFGT